MKVSNEIKILIVSMNKNNAVLLGKFLEQHNYKAIAVHSYDEFEIIFKKYNDDLALALIDITGFDNRIWELCENLRQNSISFMLFSPFPDPKLSRNGLISGAKAILTKPLIMKELLFYIQDVIFTLVEN